MTPRVVRRTLLIIMLIATLVPAVTLPVRGATTITISGSRGTDIPSCGVPSSPCKTIRYTLSVRASNGDTLNVELGTYAETLDINKSVTISGTIAQPVIRPGIPILRGPMMTTLEGVGTDRIITIESNATVTITNVIIQNGKSTAEGAGIANTGHLTLKNSIVRNNALGKFGHEKCAPCDGGGISNHGVMYLDSVTVSGNTANAGGPAYVDNGGGGIFNASGGNMTIQFSTISGNTAGAGGGMFTLGIACINLSTISGNRAPTGGGIQSNPLNTSSSATTVYQSTVAYNTTGIVGATYLFDSIVANSTVGANCENAVQSNDFNLDNGSTCGFSRPHDLMNVDPKLAPLADNGGLTQTHALLPGSAAIDKGPAPGGATGCGASDQRGEPRPQGPACDIGSFEYSSSASSTSAGVPSAMLTEPPTASGTSTVTGVPMAMSMSTTPSNTGTATSTPASGGVPAIDSCSPTQYRDTLRLLTIGYAKSGPFLMMVKAAGVSRQVMIQIFERRVLTYTAANRETFRVGKSNSGQLYDTPRYC
jgi:hypothetical protein